MWQTTITSNLPASLRVPPKASGSFLPMHPLVSKQPMLLSTGGFYSKFSIELCSKPEMQAQKLNSPYECRNGAEQQVPLSSNGGAVAKTLLHGWLLSPALTIDFGEKLHLVHCRSLSSERLCCWCTPAEDGARDIQCSNSFILLLLPFMTLQKLFLLLYSSCGALTA